MQNQPEQTKGLSVGKSALIGTAVAVPIAVGAFFLGNSNNQTPVIVQPTNQAQTTNQPAANSNVVDLKIKGNKNSRIFHLPRCPNYDDIADRNVIWFKTIEEAKTAGFRMARNCR